ncbi:MAG: beta-galactosidase, partial [Candidatus Hydrogenedentes bacterium]|nr:beta-galactosidase [Candidatus Hydrogenedentota bacterium]
MMFECCIASIVLAVLVFRTRNVWADETPNEWENPAVVQRNKERGHATLLPYSDRDAALLGTPDATPYRLSLDGVWKFQWAETVAQAPAGFFEESYDISGWTTIPVPSNWQLEGYEPPLYCNLRNLSAPAQPPNCNPAWNPTGSYRRTFTVPETWQGRQVFLHFGGIQSAAYVWVNGREVGYSQASMTPAEFDITGYLRPGENT